MLIPFALKIIQKKFSLLFGSNRRKIRSGKVVLNYAIRFLKSNRTRRNMISHIPVSAHKVDSQETVVTEFCT